MFHLYDFFSNIQVVNCNVVKEYNAKIRSKIHQVDDLYSKFKP